MIPRGQIRRRSGFTLMEMLVSLGIFAVVGTGLVTILGGATVLFQRTEALRAAADEAATVLSLLRADLRAAVTQRDGGWLHTRISDAAGNGVVAFVTSDRDLDAVNERGVGGRELVVWWVHEDGRLLRGNIPWPLSATEPIATAVRRIDSKTGAVPAGTIRVVTRGCLHFAPWLCSQTFQRGNGPVVFARPTLRDQPDWEQERGGESALGPWPGSDWEAAEGTRAPWPSAMRLTLTLAGGGTLVRTGTPDPNRPLDTATQVELRSDVTGTRFRDAPFLTKALMRGDSEVWFRGGRVLPLGVGAIRIGDEWLTVTDQPRTGVVTVQRGVRRSRALTHLQGSTILFGERFNVVWRLP